MFLASSLGKLEVFCIFNAMARALARVSTLSVELVIVKGPNEELAAAIVGIVSQH